MSTRTPRLVQLSERLPCSGCGHLTSTAYHTLGDPTPAKPTCPTCVALAAIAWIEAKAKELKEQRLTMLSQD